MNKKKWKKLVAERTNLSDGESFLIGWADERLERAEEVVRAGRLFLDHYQRHWEDLISVDPTHPFEEFVAALARFGEE